MLTVPRTGKRAWLLCWAMVCGSGWALAPPVSSRDTFGGDTPGASAALQKTLDAMDRAAADFRSAQADFVWDQYEAVVQETTTQKGVMYIRRNGRDLEMAADVTAPPEEQKYVLYAKGKVQLYQPKIDQITEYGASKNKEAVESFLVLGFGSRGHDLQQQFEVRYGGAEKVDGVDTDKLDLTPTSPRVRGVFDHIVLWIDTARGLSVRQKFFEPVSGNYRLAKYSKIQINGHIDNKVFKLQTTGKTKVVTAGM